MVQTAYKRVHCIGIGGIGISAIAILLKHRGVVVSGSDATDSSMMKDLKSHGIKVWVGSRPEGIGRDVDVVIYSSAVPEMDEERVRARHVGIREVTYNAFLGEVSEGMRVIAVTGTHGKSTTTAMIGRILMEAGFDPTVIVGSKVPGLRYGNLQIGTSDLFVVEACEHQAHMLHLSPWMIVLTNIELDHPDYYRDVDHVRETMRQFVDRLPDDGTLIWNSDDEQSRRLVEGLSGVRTVCFGTEGTVTASVERTPGLQRLHVKQEGEEIAEVTLRLPGDHNVHNAMMAFVAALSLGVSVDVVVRTLETFSGLWRRFELLGTYHGADVYTDYAHHPTALVTLLAGTRTFIPGRRIVLVFQPHQHARTRGLFDAFVTSMDAADVVIIPEIYDVVGRNEDAQGFSSQTLVDAIAAHDANRGVVRTVLFAETLDAIKPLVDTVLVPGDLLLMVGAGDIDPYARKTVSSL